MDRWRVGHIRRWHQRAREVCKQTILVLQFANWADLFSIEMKVDRSGLGLTSESSKLNYDHFYQYLTKYKSDETATYDLVFSKEFDKDERKSLHE